MKQTKITRMTQLLCRQGIPWTTDYETMLLIEINGFELNVIHLSYNQLKQQLGV